MSDLNTYNSTEEKILRDYLALDRTKLANERTFLAYLRTVIGLVASAIGLIEVVSTAWANILGFIFLALAPVCLFTGIRHFVRVKAKLDTADPPKTPGAPGAPGGGALTTR
jgi:putative membrane protein